MYFLLISQPELSMCGVLTLAENRWASSAAGITKAKVRDALVQLQSAQPRPFVLTDFATDEVLIRSFVRRDRVLHTNKLVKPLQAAVRIVRSDLLRTTLRDELQAAQGDTMHPDFIPVVDDLIKLLSSQVNTLSIGYADSGDRVPDRVKGVGVSSNSTEVQRGDVERLCNLLAERMEGNGCRRPAITKVWRDAARLMLDKDGRTEAQVTAAINWATGDEFWRVNILSMDTLRKQYEKLRLAAQRNGQASGKVAPTPAPSGVPEHMLRR